MHKPVTAEVQACFDFIVGLSTRELMRVEEVANRFGVSIDYVYGLIESGELETHRKQAQRALFLVTRRSVLAWLAKTADYQPEDFVTTLADLSKKLTRAQRAELIRRIQSGE